MKSFVAGSLILALLGYVGISNALHAASFSQGRYSEVILPLYANDSNEVIAQKIKLSAAHATIEPSVVLPFMPSAK